MRYAAPEWPDHPDFSRRFAAAWENQFDDPPGSAHAAAMLAVEARVAGWKSAAAWATLCEGLAGFRIAPPEQTRTRFAEAAAAFRETVDLRGARLAALGEPLALMAAGRNADALQGFERLIPKFDLDRPDLDNFHLMHGLSTSYTRLGHLEEALRFMHANLRLTRELGAGTPHAMVSVNLSTVLLAFDAYSEALQVVDEAQRLTDSSSNRVLRQRIAANRALCLRYLDRLDEARLAMEKLFETADDDPQQAFQYFHNAAELYITLGLVDEADALLAKAWGAAGLIDRNARIANCHWVAARIARVRGQLSEALRHAEAAAGLLRHVEQVFTTIHSRVYEFLAAGYATTDRMDLAYHWEKEAFAVYRKRFTQTTQIRVFSLRLSVELDRTRKELESFRTAAREHERQTRELAAVNASLREKLDEIDTIRQLLEEQATHDPMTGIFNRRYLDTALPELVAMAATRATPIAVALLDLDHFKQINDRYGHHAGDQVLQAMGQMLGAGIRGSDLACRYGGEEFCLLLVGCGRSAARERLDALLTEWRGKNISAGSATLKNLGFSAGIAAFPEDGNTATRLLTTADRRLYAAKNAGRARVITNDV